MKIVLDSWALLAFIFKEEPAAKKVKEIINQSQDSKTPIYISWINIGEVYYTIARRKGPVLADEVLDDIKILPINPHEPKKTDILDAAKMKSKHKLSYADAFAVSLTQKIGGIIYTGDPEIILLEGIVKVKNLRSVR